MSLIELPQEFLSSLAALEGSENADRIRQSIPTVHTTKSDARNLQDLLNYIDQLTAMDSLAGTGKWFENPYPIDSLPKHKAFFDAGTKYPERLFMAANRIGKSIAGAFELACHLTGEYPDWWTGHRFDHPINGWAVGQDARQVRDVIQAELLGPIGEWGTGMIPAHRLGKASALQGTPQAIDIIRIKHKNGGWSKLGFKNYQQDIKSFMGWSGHVIWLDEEAPLEIYNECNIRCATVNGIMMVTFTPLEGLTPLVVNFCKRADFLVGAKPIVTVDQDNPDMGEDAEFVVGRNTPKAVIQAGWDDAPWLSEEMKARLLEDTPIHLRKARSEGLPAMGSGAIYPVPIEDLLCQPFAIPESWPRMFALDVGWNQTACLWAALDPTTDTIYLHDEHYVAKEMPPVHAYSIRARGEWVHGVIDPAARGRSQVDGTQLIQNYKDLGLLLWPAKNEVESGILNVLQRLMSKRIRVFTTLTNFQKEYLLYRRDKNGKVLKENDHLMDCLRYVVNNMERMISKQETREFRGVKYVPKKYDI